MVDNLAVVYNKDLLAEAGLDEPSPDWTWDDFREYAKAMTGDGVYGTNLSVSGGEDTTWRLWPLLWQNGGQILDDDNTAAAFDSPEGEAALETLRAMAVDDKSVYLDQTDEKYGPLFRENRIGMMVTGPWEIYDTVKAGIDYGVQQLPGTDGDHTTVSGPDLWVLYDHQDANRAYWSYELISWLTAERRRTRSSTSPSATCRCAAPLSTPLRSTTFTEDVPRRRGLRREPGERHHPAADGRGLRRPLQRRRPDRSPRSCRVPRRCPTPWRRPLDKADNALKDAAPVSGAVTEAEIFSQPAIWRRAAALGADPAVARRWSPRGSGCSPSAAAPRRTSRSPTRCCARRPGSASPTTPSPASFPAGPTSTTASLTFCRSGTTTEIVDALQVLPAHWRRVVVTGVADSPVAALADDVVDLGFADETSVVQTRFPTATLVAARVATGELDAVRLDALVAQAEDALAVELPEGLEEVEHVVYLGTGWALGIAHEAALKVRESALAWAESYPSSDYRHGPLAVAGERSLVTLLGDAPDGLAADVAVTGARVRGRGAGSARRAGAGATRRPPARAAARGRPGHPATPHPLCRAVRRLGAGAS